MIYALNQILKHAWNAFSSRDPTQYYNLGTSYSYRPDRVRYTIGNERSIIGSIYNRIGIDASATSVQHVKLDSDDSYLYTIDSYLNDALTISANIDQTGVSLIQDAVMSMCDEGCVAIIPTDTSGDPMISESYKIFTLRVGQVLEWFPQHVRVKLYDERDGEKRDIILPKRIVAIVENPLYAVMNEPNSTLRRLIDKLNLLDAIDNQSGSGKLDLIVQLPYTIKTPIQKDRAEARKIDLENQLANSKYGIAYMDATEKITQLNRPAENNLMAQIEYLTKMLYSQLGITESVMDGTADDQTMLNYYNRTIDPILSAITGEMTRKFLTPTARTQRQRITYIRDPFKFVPTNQLAEIGDTMTRNAIMTSNEMRSKIGMKPSKDPKANELSNKNLNEPDKKNTGSKIKMKANKEEKK
jgi:hypothetical protein